MAQKNTQTKLRTKLTTRTAVLVALAVVFTGSLAFSMLSRALWNRRKKEPQKQEQQLPQRTTTTKTPSKTTPTKTPTKTVPPTSLGGGAGTFTLQSDPTDRYTSCAILKNDIKAYYPSAIYSIKAMYGSASWTSANNVISVYLKLPDKPQYLYRDQWRWSPTAVRFTKTKALERLSSTKLADYPGYDLCAGDAPVYGPPAPLQGSYGTVTNEPDYINDAW